MNFYMCNYLSKGTEWNNNEVPKSYFPKEKTKEKRNQTYPNVPDFSLCQKVYSTLSGLNTKNNSVALRCIEICLRLHLEESAQYRERIELFILTFLDCHDEGQVKSAGKCFHLLQQMCSGKNRGIHFKTAWKEYYLKLLGSLQNVLNLTFRYCAEYEEYPASITELLIPKLTLNVAPEKNALELYIRLRNLIIFLRTTLREPITGLKTLSLDSTFTFLSKGFAITCPLLNRSDNIYNKAVSAFVPAVHAHFYELLEDLIFCMGAHLKIYHVLFMRFVKNTLTWTVSHFQPDDISYIFVRTNRNLRLAAYKALSLWCQTYKHGSRAECLEDILIAHGTKEIDLMTNELHIKNSNVSGLPNMCVNRKRPKPDICNSKSLKQNKIYLVYVHALKCLNNFLLSSGILIKPKLQKDVIVKILNTCEIFELSHFTDSSSLSWKDVNNILLTLLSLSDDMSSPPTELLLTILQKTHIGFSTSKTVQLVHGLENTDSSRNECRSFLSDILNVQNSNQDELENIQHQEISDSKKIRESLTDDNKCKIGFIYSELSRVMSIEQAKNPKCMKKNRNKATTEEITATVSNVETLSSDISMEETVDSNILLEHEAVLENLNSNIPLEEISDSQNSLSKKLNFEKNNPDELLTGSGHAKEEISSSVLTKDDLKDEREICSEIFESFKHEYVQI